MKKINSSGFSHVELFFVFLVISAMVFLSSYVISKNNSISLQSQANASTYNPTNWIISNEGYKQLQSVNASTKLLNTLFNHTSTYFVGATTNPFPQATTIETFDSYATFLSAVQNKQIASNVKAILYDDEDWVLSPLNEQQSPVNYAQKAANLAHNHNLKLIFTPAVDLTQILAPGSSNRYSAFIGLDILGRAAPYVDVIEIQAQGAQGTSEYATFVKQAVAQIDKVKHGRIFAGMSSEPDGRYVSVTQLKSDYNATNGSVNGYWLNIPKKSVACPGCGTGNPQIALTYLQSLLLYSN
jgi:hypothetical protein